MISKFLFMRLMNHLKLLLFSLCTVLGSNSALCQSWNPSHSIGTVTGVTHFSYTQIPAQLIELQPASFSNPSLIYQWESGITPLSFQAIASADNANYTFTSPLAQTTYFRRRTTHVASGNFIFSNTVKIQIISTAWEDRNYIREHIVRKSGISTWQAVDALPIGEKMQSTSYLDGLGRSVQQVSRETATPSQSNGTWGDNVQFSKYDALGREPIKYLPYTTTTELGKFKTNPESEQSQYYTANYGETNPYGQIVFDNSPLNRVRNMKSPGTVWGNAVGTKAGYEINLLADEVQLFSIGYLQGEAPIRLGTYPQGSLFKAVTTDENGKKVVEFTDNEGKLILRKVQLADNPTSNYDGWICTYSVYDDFGQLRVQIQPEAVKYLNQNGWSFAGTNGVGVLNELCFLYHYDERGRSVWKKAPGAEPLVMLYDVRDRIVFMQDGNQRSKTVPEWTASLYDELDRPVLTTLYQTTKTVAVLQDDINNASPTSIYTSFSPGEPITDLVVSSRDQTVYAYMARRTIEFLDGFESETDALFIADLDPNATEPFTVSNVLASLSPIAPSDLNNSSVCTVLKYQFYDKYQFGGSKPFDFNFQNADAYSFSLPDVQQVVKTSRLLGFSTGSRTRVLGTNKFLNSTAYYDERGAPIQTTEDNYPAGQDVTTLQYHFDGRVLSTFQKHTAPTSGYSAFTTLTRNTFDKVGRVISIDKKWGSNTFKTIATYQYDDVGRLKTKRLDPGYTGADKEELEKLTYTYNIQNHITGINKDYALKTPGVYNKWNHFFGLYLGYDNKDGVFNAANLNGQVTGLMWSTLGDDVQRKYDYQYDNAGRLVKADFNERKIASEAWSHAKMDFSVTGANGKIEYDLNGNLLFMIQKGIKVGQSAPVVVDDLRYTYQNLTNKLIKVIDLSPLGADNGKAGDFKDGVNTGDDYVYDQNGNLVIDLNKNIKDLEGSNGKGIRYNFLDKPEEILLEGKGTIKILYDADGGKLQRTFTPQAGGPALVTTYSSNFVYQQTISGGETSSLKLQYFSFEEGRIRVIDPQSQNNGFDFVSLAGNLTLPNGQEGALDYYIRDYQQNVRMILTEEVHIGSNQCTMETIRGANEEALFGQTGTNNEVASTRFPVANIPGQNTGGGWQSSILGTQVSRLGNLVGKKIGPNALLKVMAGDKVSTQTDYYYQNAVVNSVGNNLTTSVLTSLIQALSGSAVTSGDIKGATIGIEAGLNGTEAFSFATAPDANNPEGNRPKAYLNVLFFNERMEFVQESSSALRVQGSGSGQTPLQLINLKAPKNGYCYVYLSNESDEAVYYDNFRVTHDRGRILEENHYYAYGLRIAALSSRKVGDPAEGHLENRHLYNDKELIEDGDLGWYDYGFRNYDPQIGRFLQIDPLTDYYAELTPYNYAGNDPISNVDDDGLSIVPVIPLLQPIKEYGPMTAVLVSTKVAKKSSSFLSVTGNLFKGIGKSLIGTVKAVGDIIAHPIETLKGVAYMATHPIETVKAIGEATKQTYLAFKNGDVDKRAEMIGEGLGEIAQTLLGGAAIKSATKLVSVSRAVKAARIATAVKAEGGSAKLAVMVTEVAEKNTRFIVTPGGTAIIEDAKLLKESLDKAGLKTFEPDAPGSGHILPNGVQARIMQPSGSNKLRVSFNKSNGTMVTPEGVVPQNTTRLQKAVWRMRMQQLTHVNLK